MDKVLVILKPDCLIKGLAGEAISRFERWGFAIHEARIHRLTEYEAIRLYIHHRSKGFFAKLIRYMKSNSSMLLSVSAPIDTVVEARDIMRTFREDYPGECFTTNLIHASDSLDAAEEELSLLLPEKPAEVSSFVVTTCGCALCGSHTCRGGCFK